MILSLEKSLRLKPILRWGNHQRLWEASGYSIKSQGQRAEVPRFWSWYSYHLVRVILAYFHFFFPLAGLGTEHRALCMLDKCSTTKPHPYLLFSLLLNSHVYITGKCRRTSVMYCNRRHDYDKAQFLLNNKLQVHQILPESLLENSPKSWAEESELNQILIRIPGSVLLALF